MTKRITFILLALLSFTAQAKVQWTGERYERVFDPEPQEPALIGGIVVDPADWPNSVWVGNCSATVVGEQALAVACHCMRNGATISFTKNSTRYSAKCTHHPEYRGNDTADWALCKIDKVVDGGKYEVVNADPNLVRVGDTVTDSGYGCVKWGGGIDGRFRIGDVAVSRVPQGRDYDLITRGNVALCSGDSGGASFKRFPDGSRVVLGVNSRSNTTTTSFMPLWGLATAQTWAKQWASQNGVSICGIHASAKGCRGAKPPLPNSFSLENQFIRLDAVMKAGFEAMLPTMQENIQEAIDSVN